MDINQHQLFVGNTILSLDFLYEVSFKIYGGLKEFHAINSWFLTSNFWVDHYLFCATPHDFAEGLYAEK